MTDGPYENYANLRTDAWPVTEVITGGASAILFGTLSVISAIGTVIQEDLSLVPSTGILAGLAYGGLRIARKGYDTLCSPDTYISPPSDE